MKQLLLSSAEAAAYGAKLSGTESTPHYPQPFATEIIKRLEALGGIDAFDVPSQSDALNAAIGCALSGRRTFLATSFVDGFGDLLRIAQLRLPVVAVDVSRAANTFSPERNLAAFINAGWLVFIPESNQEIIDIMIMCYRLCEDSKVMLPAAVSIDHADFYEPVSLPSEQIIKNFLQRKLKGLKKSANYAPKRQDTKSALENAVKLHAKINELWKKKFRRTYGLAEQFMAEDAERVIVTAGLHSPTAKGAISTARKNGEKVGLLRIISLRPFPDAVASLAGKNVAVVDSSNLLYNEISRRIKCSSFLLHSPSEKDFMNVLQSMKKQTF